VELVELARVPFTYEGKIPFQVMNALAATAAAWATGLNPALIVRALTTFESDANLAPGRFNRFELRGVEVIADYGHNAAGLTALGEAIQALPPRHTVMAFTLPGDRRDEDLLASTLATLPYVDRYVVYETTYRRGRAPNEVPQLIGRYLPGEIPWRYAPDQRAAILTAWRQVQPGDRLIVILDDVDEALQTLHSLTAAVLDDAECINPVCEQKLELAGHENNGLSVPLGVPVPMDRKRS
jgi:cyanophycin synthetase